MKSIVLIVSLFSFQSFAATSIRSNDVNNDLVITKMKSLKESTQFWSFSWGTDIKKRESCNNIDNQKELCNTLVEKGFNINKDIACKVSIERLENKAKSDKKLSQIGEVATVECDMNGNTFELNDVSCFQNGKSQTVSQDFVF